IEHRPYDQEAIEPALDPWRYLADRFAEGAEDGRAEIRRALEVIAAADGPVVMHCTAGKDRTGLLAALVLRLLGVTEDDVVADFALTERARDRLVADWSAAHDGRAPRWPGYGHAPERVMRLVLGDLTRRYGSVEAYAARRLGVGGTLVEELRGRLL